MLYLFLVGIEWSAAFSYCMRFMRWLYPPFFFALLIVRILFALTLSLFVWITPILANLLHSFELLLLLFYLLLILISFSLLLPLFFFTLILLSFLLNRRTHICDLSTLVQFFWRLPLFFLCDFLIQCLSVFLYRIFCILISSNLDDSIKRYLLWLIMKIFEIRMP